MKRTNRRVPKAKSPGPNTTMAPAAQTDGHGGAGRNTLSNLCLDPGKPPEVRARILLDVLQDHDPLLQQAVLTDLLRQSTAGTPAGEAQRLKECYEQALSELENGPLRPA